jgi:2-iminobutanoate/2-iminopropanoate deaminase
MPVWSQQMRQAIISDRAPSPGGSYSQAIRWRDLLFVSGQTPRDLERREVDGPFRAQAQRTYANLRALAAAGGAEMSDALQVTVYLRDLADAAEADEIFAAAFPLPRPARTTVPADIPVAIEIDAVFGVRE